MMPEALRFHRSAVSAFALPLVLLAAPAAAADAEVQSHGTFWLDDGRTGDRWELAFRDAVAFSHFDDLAERMTTSVVLAAQPINRERMREQLGSEDGWWSPHGSYVQLDLCERDGEWRVCSQSIQLGSKSISGNSSTERLVESLTVADGRVRARLLNEEPLEFFDDRYGFDVTVDLPIESFE